jgi:hypothetical protein
MALDMTSFSAALKSLYTPEKIENMVYQDHPLLAMVSKNEKFGGDNMVIPVEYGDSQNASVSISTALAGTSTLKVKKFTIERVKFYSVATVDNETLLASEGDAGAFMRAATSAIDSAIRSASSNLAKALYGSGSGKLGAVSNSSFATTTLTLTNADDVTNFEVGMVLQVSADDGGGAVRSGTLTVSGVDRDAGTLTTSANLSTGISAIAQNDIIVQSGNYDGQIKGLLAWIPSTAPSSTSFFGMDRSSDVTRLGGIRFDGSAMPIEEALIGAASRAAREGARPNYCFMNYSKFADLEKALGSKVQIVNVEVAPKIGFPGLKIQGPRGIITVIADQNCPSDRAFMLQMDTWKLHSLRKAPHIMNTDGLDWLRDANSDSVSIRVGYYAQLACKAPGYNVNIRLS